jgi:hypothetical protein
MSDVTSKLQLPESLSMCFISSAPYIDTNCVVKAAGLGTAIDFMVDTQEVAASAPSALVSR